MTHKKQITNVESILREQLMLNKYTGLYNDVESCCCDLSDDFLDCPYAVVTGPYNCTPGIRRKCRIGHNDQAYIVIKKARKKNP